MQSTDRDETWLLPRVPARAHSAAATEVVAWTAPLLAGAVHVVVLLASGAALVADLRWNSDIAVVSRVATTLGSGGARGHIFVQQPLYPWAGALIYRLSPWPDQLWPALPGLSVALAALLLAITVTRIAGDWAGVMTAVLLLCATPAVLLTFIAPSFHGFTWATMIVLAAYLVHRVRLGPGAGRRGELALGVGVAFLAGLVAASDALLVVVGIAPWALAAGYVWWRRRDPLGRALLAHGLLFAGVTATTFVGVHIWMARSGYSSGLPGTVSHSAGGAHAIMVHLRLLLLGLADLAGGLGFDATGSGFGVLLVPASVLALGAALAAARYALRQLLASGRIPAGREAGRALVVFWLGSSLGLVAAFVGGGVVQPGGEAPPWQRVVAAVRYLPPLFIALAAVFPLALRSPRGRAFGGVLIGGFGLISTVTLASAAGHHAFRPTPTNDLPALVRFLEGQRIRRVYTSYWDAQPLWLESDGAIDALPVAEGPDCGDLRTTMCDDTLNTVQSWFAEPRPPVARTAIVVDPENDFVRSAPAASLGTPVDVRRVRRFTVYTFTGDVATGFDHAHCRGRADHRC